jgi:hypothetical protein
VGLGDYLVLEGMSHRLVPYKANSGNNLVVNQEITKKCLFEPPVVPNKNPQYGFMFRGLTNDKLFFDQTQKRMLEMYRTVFVWLAGSYAEDSTKKALAKETLERMETVLSKNVVKMDYRQMYQIAMIYNTIGDKIKFDEYSAGAEIDAIADKKNSANNLQSYYNPYRVLLDIYEAKGDYQKALNLLNELDPRDPSVNQKRESIKMKMTGAFTPK